MTKKELAKLFWLEEEHFHKFFKQASETHKGIAAKQGTSTVYRAADYTLEECIYAVSLDPMCTRMWIQYLKENFVSHGGLYHDHRKKNVKLSQSARKFLYFWKCGIRFKCCNTCAYITARKPNKAGTAYSPYCNLYGRFINKTNLDVYKDRCTSYDRGTAEPVIWGTDPRNIDLSLSRSDTCLGINNGDFTTGTADEVTLLAELKRSD